MPRQPILKSRQNPQIFDVCFIFPARPTFLVLMNRPDASLPDQCIRGLPCALNVPAQQTVYPGEGHVFDADPDGRDSRDATARVVAFFVQTLK